MRSKSSLFSKYIKSFSNHRRNCSTTGTTEWTILGEKAKKRFQVGLFVLSGSIFGGLYHFSTNEKAEMMQKQVEENMRVLNESLLKDNEDLSTLKTKLYGQFFDVDRTVNDIQPVIEAKDYSIDAKTVKKHLKVIGFDKQIIIDVLNDKSTSNKQLNVSEIIDEVIERYKAEGKACIVEKYNKLVKVNSHETKVMPSTPEVLGLLPGFFYCHKKYEKTEVIIGKQQEGGCKIVTKLNVDAQNMSFWRDEKFLHFINVFVLTAIAGGSAILAFKTRPARKEIFLDPVLILKSLYFLHFNHFFAD